MATEDERRERRHTDEEVITAEWRGRVDKTLEYVAESLHVVAGSYKDMVKAQGEMHDQVSANDLRISSLERCISGVQAWIKGVVGALVVLSISTVAATWWRNEVLMAALSKLQNGR